MARRRAFFWRVPVRVEVDEELEAHIELQTLRFVREGLSPAEARARALRRFGDRAAVREQCANIRQHMETDMRRSEYWQELRQDVLFALRGFRRAPLFTAVALLTIALGVGASSTIFSVVNTVLLRPLPYPNADRVMVLFNSYEQTGLERAAVSGAELFDFRETFRSLDAIAAIRPTAMATLTGDGSEPEPVSAYVVTPNLFEVLGLRPALGRGFLSSDGTPGATEVAVLSHALWQRRFAGDSGIIGRQIVLNDVRRTVVGVMPAGIRFPDAPVGYARARADLWVASSMELTRTAEQRGNQNLVVLGRRANGATDEAITRDLAAVSARFKREFSDRYASAAARNWRPIAVTLRDEVGGAVRPALWMLSGAVALVLMIACANVANLLLARTALRHTELAVRLALGANRLRLLRQLLTESMVLALGGGALGVALAAAAVQGLRTHPLAEMPRLEGTRLDVRVFLFSFAVAAVAGLLIGLIPALQQSATRAGNVLGEAARGATGGLRRRRVRAALVAAQVAMAVIVLDTAGLLARSFAALQRVDSGFDASGVMTSYVSLPRRQGGAYDSAYKVAAFYERLAARMAAIPGVASTGGVYPLPVSGDGWSSSFDVDGLPPETQEAPHAEMAAAMPGYFRTMGIPVRGREFTFDDRAGRPMTVIVDEQLAKKYWPAGDAIGKRISRDAATGRWMTIVGVAGHVRRDGPGTPGQPQIYLPYLQHPQGMLYMVARTADPYALSSALREAVRSLDSELPVSKQRALSDLEREVLARPRFNLVLIVAFALVALLLAGIGLYGVMAYLVAQRTREIGIRVALGSRPAEVRGLVVRESMSIALTGLAVGTAGSIALARGLTGMLFEVQPTDPLTYTSIALLLLAVAALAASGPARRATRVDPLVALRG